MVEEASAIIDGAGKARALELHISPERSLAVAAEHEQGHKLARVERGGVGDSVGLLLPRGGDEQVGCGLAAVGDANPEVQAVVSMDSKEPGAGDVGPACVQGATGRRFRRIQQLAGGGLADKNPAIVCVDSFGGASKGPGASDVGLQNRQGGL